MTDKQILLDAIHLKKTPRQPAIILSGGVWANKQIGLSLQDSFDISPTEAAENVIITNELVKSDLVWTAAGCNNLVLRAIGVKTTFSNVGVAASVDERLISSAEEVDKLDINDIERDPGIAAMLETTRILKERIGSEVLIGISQWGPMTLGGLLMGTEDFMILTMKDKEAAEYVMDFTEKLTVKYWKLFVEAGAELVSQAEPSASGDMISHKQFEKMVLPHLQSTNKAIDGQVKAKMLHICGNINRILPYLPQTGSDVISFDYKVDLKLTRETLGGKMAFAGKLDPVSVMQLGTPEQVIQLTKEYIDEAESEKGGYIVMPGCDLAPATPLENIQAMIGTAKSTLFYQK